MGVIVQKVPFTKDYSAKIAAAVSNVVEGCVAVSVIVLVKDDASACLVYGEAHKVALGDAMFKALPEGYIPPNE